MENVMFSLCICEFLDAVCLSVRPSANLSLWMITVAV